MCFTKRSRYAVHQSTFNLPPHSWVCRDSSLRLTETSYVDQDCNRGHLGCGSDWLFVKRAPDVILADG